MTVCCAGWIGTIQPEQQTSKKNNKYQNTLRISCASSWFFFTW